MSTNYHKYTARVEQEAKDSARFYTQVISKLETHFTNSPGLQDRLIALGVLSEQTTEQDAAQFLEKLTYGIITCNTHTPDQRLKPGSKKRSILLLNILSDEEKDAMCEAANYPTSNRPHVLVSLDLENPQKTNIVILEPGQPHEDVRYHFCSIDFYPFTDISRNAPRNAPYSQFPVSGIPAEYSMVATDRIPKYILPATDSALMSTCIRKREIGVNAAIYHFSNEYLLHAQTVLAPVEVILNPLFDPRITHDNLKKPLNSYYRILTQTI